MNRKFSVLFAGFSCILLGACDKKIPDIVDQCGTIVAMSQMVKHVDITHIAITDAGYVPQYPNLKPEMHPQWIDLTYQFSGQDKENARCLVFTINGKSGIEAFQLSEKHLLSNASAYSVEHLAEVLTNVPNLDWKADGYEKRAGSPIKFSYFGIRR